MNYATFYSAYFWGVELEGDEFNKVNAYFNHLHEAGISDDEIIKAMLASNSPQDFSFEHIPNSYWNESLLTKGEFYTHPALRILPKAPIVDGEKVIEPEHFVEMKIRFTMNDLALYYKEQVNPEAGFYDEKRTIGTLNYLIDKYKHIEIGTPLEFVLRLIDASKNKKVEPIRLADNESAVFQKHKVETLNGKGKIVWRSK